MYGYCVYTLDASPRVVVLALRLTYVPLVEASHQRQA